jgi:Holliday junction resolvase RusA-like endonuclease
MHLEFVVPGPPISNQQSSSKGLGNLKAWKAKIINEASNGWKKPCLSDRLKVTIINFHSGNKPSLDVDNLSKPILDSMNKLVYDDDRQVRQAHYVHMRIDAPMIVAKASSILVSAVQAGNEFVYVRIEDPVDPFPLPN